MTGKRIQIGAILFALIMAVSVVAPASAGLTGGEGEVQFTEEIAEIDDALQSADGTIEAVVRLDELDDSVIQAQGADALRNHAETTQNPVTTYADSNEGVSVHTTFWITNAVILEIDTDVADLEEVASIEGVEELHPNFEVRLPDEPSTEATTDRVAPTVQTASYDVTYGLDQINAPDVWADGNMGAGATIAVLDTGVDADHPDIQESFAGFAEFDDDGNIVGTDPYDSDQHGTHVSGTVVGGDASGEYIGVAPEADLLHGLVLDGGSGSWGAIMGGMEWGVDEDADAISMSLGVNDYEDQFIDPIQNAHAAGTIVISASGNDGHGTSGSPANVYDGMAIGATDADEQVTSFSSGEVIDTSSAWGSAADDHWPDEYIVPDVVAPGNDVKSAIPGGSYDEFPGTSMATPHVSGVVALMVSEDPTLSPADIEEALIESTFKPGGDADEQDDRYGYGIVDATEAVDVESVETGVTGTVVDEADGEPVDGATVELDDGSSTSTDANGEFELTAEPGTYDLTVSGPGIEEVTETVTVEDSGELTDVGTIAVIVEDLTEIGLVGTSYTDDIQATLEDELPNFQFGTVTTVEDVSGYDAIVAENLDPVDTSAFVSETETEDVGVVYLDMWGDEANAIPQFAAVTTAVSDTDEGYQVDEPIQYEAVDDHEILGDIDVGEEVLIHQGEYPDHTWFETDEFDVIATVNDANGQIGPALAVDDGTNTVLASTLTYNEYVGPDDFSAEADTLLGNAVEHVVPEDEEPEPDPAEFSIDAVDAPTTGEVDETVTVDATVSNVGDEAGETTVAFEFDGVEEDNAPVELDGGETTTETFELTLPAQEGEYDWQVSTDDDSQAGVIEVTDDTEPSEPGEVSVNVDDASVEAPYTTGIDLEIGGADDGISAYEVELELDDSSVAEIANVSLTGDPVFPNVEVDGDSAILEVGMGDDVHEAGDVVIAEILVEGIEEGTTQLSIGNVTVTAADDDMTEYDIAATSGATIDVTEQAQELPPVVGDLPPQDLNDDGLFRDVDGDGEFDVFDVQALFSNLDSDAVQDYPEAYNFAGNDDPDEVTIFDVQALWSDYTTANDVSVAP